jgi:ribonuclease P protein subunit POP4
MSNEFNIEEFLNTKFKKLEKKTKDTSIKPKKEINQDKMFINDHSFDNIIDITIYDKLSSSKDNLNINSLFQPLFPSEKVFQAEFTGDKTFLLDKYIATTENKPKKPKKLADNRKFIEQLKADKSLNYKEMYETMFTLWSGYIKTLLNNATQPDTIYNKILKADLHGSIIQVVEAKNKCLIGVEGLVLLETKRSFVIITIDNKVKVILKKSNVFRIDLQYTAVKIIGDNFTYKAVERTKAKFKNKFIL